MNAASVRKELERILASPEFDASARNRRFLEYIVEETLASRAHRLKGLTIAIDVFGRAATLDPQHDPVVRIEAAKLRRSLERYYLTAGREDPIRIDIPRGAYVPTFEEREYPTADSPAPANEPAVAVPALALGHTRPRWYWPSAAGFAIVSSAVLAVAVAIAWLWLARAPANQDGAQAAANLQLQGPAVVVAPFEDLTGTESGRLFASGVTQELITNLMRFKDLRVYAVRSNEQWNENLAQRLDVRYVVEGRLRRTPDRIHLIVHLSEVASGRYLWSETYDRLLTTENVFAVQEELATELAGRLAEPYGVVHKVSADLFRRPPPADSRRL
jgi:adenylate cyclase